MYIDVYQPRIVVQRRVYLPSERGRIHDGGLGETGLGGFNIGKMFKRIVTIKPSSFQFKNIMGAVGSVVSNIATGGLASVVSGKTFSAHSSAMKGLGTGLVAASAVVAGGVGLSAMGVTGAGVLGAGKTLLAGGKSLVGALGSAKSVLGVFGGGGGGAQQMETGGSVIVQEQPQQQYYNPGYQPTIAEQYGFPAQYYPTITSDGGSAPAYGYSPAMSGGGSMLPVVQQVPYEGSGGPVDEYGRSIPQSTIISGVEDKHVYIAGGLSVLALLMLLS